MPNENNSGDGLKLADRATLSLLSALEDNTQPTQRGLAQRIGVALGMTNSLLKRAVRKGMVKVKDAPAKRYAYYVTPKGLREKSRLVAEYLNSSLTFFRKAREEYETLYTTIEEQGHTRVMLFGAGELAEIATLSAHLSDIELCGIIETGCNQAQFAGVPVYASLEAALTDNIDAVVITAAKDPQGAFDHVAQHIKAERVYSVPLLHISRNGSVRG